MTSHTSQADATPRSLAEWEALLPEPAAPIGSYQPVVRSGNLLYTSGVLPLREGQLTCTGHVGSIAVGMEQARDAARLCALNALAIIKAHTGSLSAIKRIVKLTGFVSSAPSFYEQPAVINGASDLLVDILGDAGRHARSAVGVYSLPKDASVELELIVEI